LKISEKAIAVRGFFRIFMVQKKIKLKTHSDGKVSNKIRQPEPNDDFSSKFGRINSLEPCRPHRKRRNRPS
jgi:hypothetical protein